MTIGDAPTLTVIVLVVVFVIDIVCPDTGSVDLGYVFVAVFPSIAHVKDNALSAMVSVLDVDKL